MATMVIALAVTLYMVLGPVKWVRHLMQLTHMSLDFRILIIAIGAAYLCLAWAGEMHVFQRLARMIGRAKQAVARSPKKRKQYKTIQERMLF